MSVYNGERFLRASIESLLSQSLHDFECIIVDDASTDGTASILKGYAAKDPRILVLANTQNLGLTKSLNRAIGASKGAYVARMDADDVSHPARLEKEAAFLDQHPGYALVGTWATIIDERDAPLRTIRYPAESKELKRALIRYNPFFHSSIMMRRDALDAVGAYDERWKFAQDYELYFRIARRYDIANLPEVLLAYRESAGSITGKKNRAQVGFVIRAKLRALLRGQYGITGWFWLVPSIIAWLLPVSTKRYIKKLLAK